MNSATGGGAANRRHLNNDNQLNRVLYIVMAGGRGERLRPLTDSHPKPLVRFGPAGRIIDFTLYNCLSSGYGDVLVLTQYRADMMQQYLDKVWKPAFDAQWRNLVVMPSDRSPKGSYLGTADAVYQALLMRDEIPWYVVVLAGDHVYHMDYRHMIRHHQARQAAATVGAVMCERDQAHRFGIIKTGEDGNIDRFIEKPRNLDGILPRGKKPLASMGIYVFTGRELIRYLENNQDDSSHDFGHDVLPRMAGEGDACAYSFLKNDGLCGYWRDVGDLQSYWQAHMELLEGRCRELYFDAVPGLLRPPFSMANLVRKQAAGRRHVLNSLVAETANIGGAEVRESVIGPGVTVEDGAVIENSVILDRAVIRRGARLSSVIVETRTDVKSHYDSWAGDLAVTSMPGIHPMQVTPPALPGRLIQGSSENNLLPA